LAIGIGAAIAALTYTITALVADVPFSVGGLVKATFIGAASSAVTFGIGSAATNMFTNFYSQAAFQAAAHGTFQGSMTAISGGKFWSGFASGALSSIAASVWSGGSSMDGYGKSAHALPGTGMRGIGAGTGDLGMIAFGTVSGGAGAAMTGGNFWQGAVTGLVVSGLNHAAHSDDNGYDKNGNQVNNNGGDTTDYLYDNGEIISSTSVTYRGISQGEFGSNGGNLRGYGFNGFKLSTGAIVEDNTIFELATGGNLIKGAGKSFKFLRASGGKINGFSISRGAGYGAKGRFDFHKLVNASKKSNTFPQWVKGKTLPHYHRGAGNNLHRHRPWEKGWNDKSFWDLF